ncbi:MAG: glycosyltransferase family 2 protein [bacterium]|nr:glycosyltransferase family 2 protein [bacterium]
MTKVAVVILNWNRKSDTLECLQSVLTLDASRYTLIPIVVDNNSNDGSVQAFENLKNIVIVKNRDNLGYTGGNNSGIKKALELGADFVMVLNNDTVLDKNLVVELLKGAEEHPEAGIFTPKIYFAKGFEFHKDKYKESELGKVIWAAGGKIDWDNVFGNNRGVDEVDNGQFEKSGEVDFGTGACLFVRKEVFDKIGMFNDRYFMYYEDTDFCMRAGQAGFKTVYVPRAILWHKVAQSSGIGSGLNDYFISRNRMLFGTLYASFRTRFALLRESLKLILFGREWQKKGVVDFYLGIFGKGSWK